MLCRYILLFFCVQLFSQTPNTYCFEVQYGSQYIESVKQITEGFKSENTSFTFMINTINFNFESEDLPVSNVSVYWNTIDGYKLRTGYDSQVRSYYSNVTNNNEFSNYTIQLHGLT